MLEDEQDHGVLQSILVALSHQGRSEAVLPALRFRHHDHPEVRHAVVLVMSGQENEQAIAVLIELTSDPETRVRDWATFALGTLVDLDTPEVREALAERLNDDDDDTRAEAVVGLAKRGDRRILTILQEDLARESVGSLSVEAAALMGDPQLYPLY